MATGRSWQRTAGSPDWTRRSLLYEGVRFAGLGLGALCQAEEPRGLTLALSDSLFSDFNAADARAAMSVWIQRISKELKLDLRCDPRIFEPLGQVVAKLRAKQVETVGVSVVEYRQIQEYLETSEVTVPTQKSELEYMLLVRSDSGVKSVPQLRGKKLVVLKSLATRIAPAWLSNLVSIEEPAGYERFFGEVTFDAKAARVILPVFFGRADVCLATSSVFQTMTELNPQVAGRVRPIAVSPEIVTAVYAYRKGWDPRLRGVVVKALSELKSTAAGRQVLTLFQCESLTARPASCLKPALAILDQYEKPGRKFSWMQRKEEWA